MSVLLIVAFVVVVSVVVSVDVCIVELTVSVLADTVEPLRVE